MKRPWEDMSLAANNSTVKENFESWFAASKVVDLNGMPLRVYHGTNHAIEAFDFKRLGCSVDNPTTHFGTYFSADPDDAATWADRAADRRRASPSQNIVAAYLSLQNPITLPAEIFQYYLRTARQSTILKHKLKWMNQGRDGIITARDGKTWYVAFRPDQIKSAVSNSGLYLANSASTTDQQAAIELMASSRAARFVQACTEQHQHRRKVSS